jgi:O-acetyl-ADP-ribose deacetylase (regulator of RNase III)
MEYIERGLVDLEKTIFELGIGSIAIPPLGCGNGGLDWNIVKSKIINSLSKFNSLNIEIYEPSGAPEILSKAPGKL